MFQYKAKEIKGSVLDNLDYKINIKIRQEQRFLNVMLIIAFLNILVIKVTK